MRNTISLDIAAPPGAVFELVDGPRNLKRWMEGLLETRETLRTPEGVGSKFHQRIAQAGQVAEYDGEIIAYEPPKHLRVRLCSSLLEMEVDYRMSPKDDGTHLKYVVETHLRNRVMQALADLFSGGIVQGIFRRQLAKLKEVAEQEQ